jgi:hypothetical protein
MNELPEDRKAIHGRAQRELYDHAQGSADPDGPYRRTAGRTVARLITLAVATITILVIVGLLHD